jgi:exodeoxyribonuclease VII small subunit
MAKTRGETSGGKTAAKSGHMKNFEERLERLEVLGEKIRKTDIPLDEAIKAFEEGIKLAKTLELDLEKIESRIEILMNDAQALSDEAPELELFEPED